MLKVLQKIPVCLLAMFLTFVLTASLMVRAEYCAYRYSDNPVWARQDFFTVLFIVNLVFLYFLVLQSLNRRLSLFDRDQVIYYVLFFSALIQISFILLFPARQFADQDSVNRIAMQVIEGNFSQFRQKGYLYRFPNNVGITLFLSLLYRIYPAPLLLPKLMNIVFSTATSYLTFRIYEESNNEEYEPSYLSLILSSFFPPMILLNNMVYNDIYSAALFAGAVYNAVMHVKTKRNIRIVYACLLIVAGNFLRQMGVIFLLALTIYFILKKMKIRKALSFLGIGLILLQLPLFAVNTFLLSSGEITEPLGKNSIPVYMWLNIGMNHRKIGYWDDSESYRVYTNEGQWDKEKSAEIYKSLIRENLRKNGIKGIANTYVKKNIWLWTEGTYQAEYYGIGSWGYLYHTVATKVLEHNQLFRDLLRWFLHGSNLLLLFLTLFGLIYSITGRREYPFLLPAIVFLGFIGFYTLWEIKPRYVFPVYPYLIVTSNYGFSILYNKLLSLREKRIQKKILSSN